MPFTQTIEVRTEDPQAVQDHVAAFHTQQKDKAPGYRRARVLEDGDRPGTYVIEVDFTSAEEAKENSNRPETGKWAQELRSLIAGEPAYRNLNQLCSTES
jgi:quinol monooxygenase YgiN